MGAAGALIISRGLGSAVSDANGDKLGRGKRSSCSVLAESVEESEAVDEVDVSRPVCCVCTDDNHSSASSGDVVLCTFMPHALSSALCTVAAVRLSSTENHTVNTDKQQKEGVPTTNAVFAASAGASR